MLIRSLNTTWIVHLTDDILCSSQLECFQSVLEAINIGSELLEEEGQTLADRYPFEALQREATFTTVATQVQTALSSVTTGFNYIVNDTIWNRTLRRPVYGPKSQQDWQQSKAMYPSHFPTVVFSRVSIRLQF